MHEFDDLRVLMQAHSPLIVIESYEEPRALLLIKRLAVNLMRPVFKWTITDGLQRLDSEHSAQAFNAEPTNLLAQIKGTRNSGIYVLCDFHPFLADAKHVRYIKEIALAHEQLGHTLILLSHAITIPPELSRLAYRFELSLPSDQQIRQLVHDMADSYTARHGMLAELGAESVALLVQNLRGLTFEEVKRLAYKAIADDGAVTKDDIPRINRAKFNLLQTDGVLSQVFDSVGFDSVIGLTNLKHWITQRHNAFIDNAKDTPKGVLLTGVQGTGKSLAAKAIAGSWQLPLLRLDMAALYNKYIGETEKNLAQALALADAMSPCVLWIDEIEKGLSGGDSDNGVTRRLLGSFLTWLSERKSQVFLVATANNIHELAPELLRKGRFDEIFFVDLPNETETLQLLKLHLAKRQLSLADEVLQPVLALCRGFSGAELEQAVVGASFRARADGTALSLLHLMDELAATQPLSVVMAEQINALRQWALQRCVQA
ncbi:MAG: AAA family ATPase [Gammaproteobacteria bacterium]|nr:AAA family ATPase [Gammaproteobacteria bacterium]MBU1556580.1 AAA family ATPase [Gammaproteobacteria bacterium]MBU2072620.1 AAA family ATPase [Gammaproteobacteria bacterium]MBU2182246.1 AAA family ATPase [Gammaproteobacteria bacterium]MBU2204750.1 AAA family ATPase [Gammaproteobacteria bacterium]